MEFLKSAKQRSALSESLYIALNILLAIAALFLVNTAGFIWPAIVLVILSKWRVLAVRPRYWMANIQANLVDFIVSISFVVFLMQSIDNLGVQIVITALYIAWLLFLKPQSKKVYVTAQASLALAFGTAAIFILSATWPVFLVVLLMWLVGYISARHMMGSYNESHLTQLSLLWGFVVAQLGWLGYHWTFAYEFAFLGDLKIPQMTIIIMAISFMAERLYDAFSKDNFSRQDIILPVVFPLLLIFAILLFLNNIIV